MKAFARLTAIIFIILGIIIILAGISFAVSGIVSQASNPPTPSLIPDMSGLMVLARVFGGAAIGLQGLFLAAIGQVIWLLANISDQTEKTSEHLGVIARRASQPKQ